MPWPIGVQVSTLQFIHTKVLPVAGLDFSGVDTEIDVGACSATWAAAVAAVTLADAVEPLALGDELDAALLVLAALALLGALALLLLDELHADRARLTLATPITTVATTPVDRLVLLDLFALPIITHSSSRFVAVCVRGLRGVAEREYRADRLAGSQQVEGVVHVV
jgi:hypothetical protein